MARKTAGTLVQQQNRIKRDFKRGPRKHGRDIRTGEAFSDIEREVKQQVACYLKAQDFSYTYIADALDTTRDTVRRWFDDPALGLHAQVAKIQEDFVTGAVKLLKTYAIDIIETLMGMFHETEDEQLAVKIGFELLDRLGIAKVNKSESIAANINREESEVNLTDKDGLIEKLRGAPPELQARVAQQMEDLRSMVSEGAVRDG